VNQLHNPLTSTRVIDHSCAANNNIPNVGTGQVMSLSTLLKITVLFNYLLYLTLLICFFLIFI
jgi:hypothetical protein